ncbi:hypothetical protein [Streptomyces sp. NBC_00425]|uniref:hypothetical protein n=1 Tax=Streptomyces sp. NBC_00425 TaxID=2975740 RepID=UPI002E1E4CFA
MTSASERWTQRVLGGLSARPIGHGEAVDADGPQVPVQSPQPPQPTPIRRPAPRLPHWWEDKPTSLAPDEEPAEEQALEDQPAEEQAEEPDVEEPPTVEEPPKTAPAPSGPVEKIPADAPKRTGVRKAADLAAEDRSTRFIAFNLSAGGAGYALGIVPFLGKFLPAAEHGAVGMLGLTTAVAGGYAAWHATRFPAVRQILPVPPVSRVVIIAGAAEIGRRMAPVPVAWLNVHGQQWGLGPSAVSLLITAGAMCGGLWWFIDRRVRHWHWTARWLVRIPLASAVLATGLYAPGVTP